MVQKRATAESRGLGTTGKAAARKVAMTIEGGGFKAHYERFAGCFRPRLGEVARCSRSLGVQNLEERGAQLS